MKFRESNETGATTTTTTATTIEFGTQTSFVKFYISKIPLAIHCDGRCVKVKLISAILHTLNTKNNCTAHAGKIINENIKLSC